MLKKIFVLIIFGISLACQNSINNSPQTVSASDLTEQYEKSGASVRQMYNGKEIVVRGYAKERAIMPKSEENEGLIMLEEKEGIPVRHVFCWFGKKEVAKFEQISGAQYITVKGVFNGENSTELKFCQLVKIE